MMDLAVRFGSLVATFVATAAAVGCGASERSGATDPAARDAGASAAVGPDEAAAGPDVAAGSAAVPLDAEGAAPAADGPAFVDAADLEGATGGSLVARCEAMAESFAAICQNEQGPDGPAPDTERVCVWNAYAAMCRTGDPQRLLDSMSCFSGNPNCWTFSDSNSAGACLDDVYLHHESLPAGAFFQRFCATCGSVCPANPGELEILPYLSGAQLAMLEQCWAGGIPSPTPSACDSATLVANCPWLAPLLASFSCR